MKKTNSISIANTQMQLINCMEAVVAYNCHFNWLLNGNLSKKRNEQIESFYRVHNLDRYFTRYINLRFIKSDSYLSYWINICYSKILLLLVLLLNKFDYVFIGHYLHPIHRFVVAKAEKKNSSCKCVLVDDGTGTMLFAKERKIEYENKCDRCVYDRSSKLLFSTASEPELSPKTIEYFTIYPLEDLLQNDNIRKNHYGVIKSWGNTSDICILPNTMIIVGQTLVEEGIVSLLKYQELLSEAMRKVKKLHNVSKFIYCPHPGESNVEMKLTVIDNIIIHRNKDPFELFALLLPQTCIVVGFFSSSLWNLAYLGIDACLKYIYVAEDDILCKEPMKSHIINIYKTYNSSTIIDRL